MRIEFYAETAYNMIEVIGMDLYKEILINVLMKREASVTFPEFAITPEEIVEQECYQALNAIKRILHDDTLSDPECFTKIEEVICLFERLGSSGGFRHDFG